MIIKLKNNYYLKGGYKTTIVLCEEVETHDKDTKERTGSYEKVHGYYPDVEMAILSYAKRFLNNSGKEFENIKDYQKELNALIEEAME